MNRHGLLLCAITASAFLSCSTQAQECEVKQHVPIPTLSELPYSEARQRLIAAGWQPASINPMNREEVDAGGNAPLFLEQGYDEVVSCSGTGLAYCLFAFTDIYGNRLEVVTAGEEAGAIGVHATVTTSRLACGEE